MRTFSPSCIEMRDAAVSRKYFLDILSHFFLFFYHISETMCLIELLQHQTTVVYYTYAGKHNLYYPFLN